MHTSCTVRDVGGRSHDRSPDVHPVVTRNEMAVISLAVLELDELRRGFVGGGARWWLGHTAELRPLRWAEEGSAGKGLGGGVDW